MFDRESRNNFYFRNIVGKFIKIYLHEDKFTRFESNCFNLLLNVAKRQGLK